MYRMILIILTALVSISISSPAYAARKAKKPKLTIDQPSYYEEVWKVKKAKK
jgi:hypothetical protein